MIDGSLIAATDAWMGYTALAAVVILTLLSLRRGHLRTRTSESPETYAQEQISRLREQGDVKGDMQELLVELQELSRQINAQIDTKFAKLEASMRAADERIDRLERLVRIADGGPAIDTVVGHEGALAQTRPGHQQSPRSEPSTAEAAVQATQAPDDHAVIYALADAGRAPVDIARETGRSTGEIELVLALRPLGGPRET